MLNLGGRDFLWQVFKTEFSRDLYLFPGDIRVGEGSSGTLQDKYRPDWNVLTIPNQTHRRNRLRADFNGFRWVKPLRQVLASRTTPNRLWGGRIAVDT